MVFLKKYTSQPLLISTLPEGHCFGRGTYSVLLSAPNGRDILIGVFRFF